MSVDATNRLAPGDYFYDDIAVGDFFDTGGIKVTEAHVVAFAGISGDHFDIHVDDDFAMQHGFSGRVAHGLLGLSMADGLKNRAPVRLKAIASLGWNWNFRRAIMLDDRISARVIVKHARTTKREDRGLVTLFFDVVNQHGETVQDGETLLLVQRRGEADRQ